MRNLSKLESIIPQVENVGYEREDSDSASGTRAETSLEDKSELVKRLDSRERENTNPETSRQTYEDHIRKLLAKERHVVRTPQET